LGGFAVDLLFDGRFIDLHRQRFLDRWLAALHRLPIFNLLNKGGKHIDDGSEEQG
jgi:hypothetical protein